jgi:hypothetical protein
MTGSENWFLFSAKDHTAILTLCTGQDGSIPATGRFSDTCVTAQMNLQEYYIVQSDIFRKLVWGKPQIMGQPGNAGQTQRIITGQLFSL